MLRKLFFLLIASLLYFGSYAEDFMFTGYNVDITINSDGSIDVTERLGLYFTAQRHGIIRQIPFRYNFEKQEGVERAERDEANGFYEIMFKDVNVEGLESETYTEGDYFNIKIGSADKYLEGTQTIVIHYTVWGALNPFSEHTEFYWNVIGHEWPMNIPKVSFRVHCPEGSTVKDDDVLVYKGISGSTTRYRAIDIAGSSIETSSDISLMAEEGVTVAIKFPKTTFKSTSIPIEMLTKEFYIDEQFTRIHITETGMMEVEDTYKVVFLEPQYKFARHFNYPGFTSSSDSYFQDFYVHDAFVSVLSDPKRTVHASLRGYGDDKNLILFPDSGALQGTMEFKFQYQVSGAARFDESTARFKWPLAGGFDDEPIRICRFEISADSSLSINKELILFHEGNGSLYNLPFQKEQSGRLTSSCNHTLANGNALFISIPIYTEALASTDLPPICYAQQYMIRELNCHITVEESGEMHIRKDFDVIYLQWPDESNRVRVTIPCVYDPDRPYGMLYDISWPDWSWIGNHSKLSINNLKVEGEDWEIDIDHGNWDITVQANPKTSYQQQTKFSIEYDVFGMLTKEGDSYVLQMPLTSSFNEPVGNYSFEVILPEEGTLVGVDGKFHLTNGKEKYTLPLRVIRNRITGSSNLAFNGDYLPIIRITIPSKAMKISGSKRFNICWINNFQLMLPLILLVLLAILWFLFGRDRKTTLIVAYKPPADLSPAEAGYIWDFKVHKRDLVSLIYHWAGHGFLSIKQIGSDEKPDYTLTKLKELPDSAKSFEKNMFNGLFRSGNSTNVSSLRNSFYSTMQTAGKDLKAQAGVKDFFLPGARRFAIALQVTSWFLICWGAIHILVVSHNNLQVMLGYLLSFAMLQFFGRNMPKRAPFGSKKFNELRGFKEFIVRAESYKLKELLDENPAYFDETVAYAIVMGLGKEWADKFKELITAPPAYYQGHSGAFDTRVFMHSILLSMHKMESDFHYKYTPPSKSSYSYSSSSGGSSYSYRSSGGGGFSSFGGGGHSGGGFGGGGGKSW